MLNHVNGSLVTYDANNPMFTTIDIDLETLLPLNIHNYAFDLEHANAQDTSIPPHWHEI